MKTIIVNTLSRKSKSTLALLVAFSITASAPTLAQSQTVACDFVDQQLASTILQSPIKPHKPNRQIQTANGLAFSDCVFFGSRSILRVTLVEYPSPADSMRAFRDSTAAGGNVTYVSEKGLGDEATWWSIGSEAHGYLVRKGNRALKLDSRWHDSMTTNDAKARLKPVISSMASKL